MIQLVSDASSPMTSSLRQNIEIPDAPSSYSRLKQRESDGPTSGLRPAAARQPSTGASRGPELQVPTGLPAVLRRRDPAAIRRALPYFSFVLDRYFRAEVEGVDNLSNQASLIVSTHNGGLVMPDLHALGLAFWRRFGAEAPAFGLIHKLGLRVPGFGPYAVSCGAIEASRDNAATVLRSDFPLLVCPGGDADSLRPFALRHRVSFGKRRGFIRTAIAEQVPIVPVISVGAHEVFFVLNDGRRLARLSGAARWLRLKSIPLTWSFPFGLTIGGLPSLPLPSTLR